MVSTSPAVSAAAALILGADPPAATVAARKSYSFQLLLWLRNLLLFLVTWSMAAVASAGPTEKTYIVQRGDTLSGIAHTHGVPLTKMAQRNKVSRNHRVRIGERLIVPVTSSTKARSAQARPELPGSVQRAINSASVKSGRWKNIVIHHSGVNTGTVAGMDRYHREVRRMENGLAYHFVIGNSHGLGDGEIGVGARWTKQLDGGHLISERQNKVSIGICLVGNFDDCKPTDRQMERLTALVQALMARCNLSPGDIKTHQQINVVHTRCPGRHFPLRAFLASLGS